MASSSSLPVTIPQKKYDVFVSFRGEDTRNNFTSHLYDALRGKQIKTFIDHQLEKGDEISPALVTAIEGSVISVVVFSKQYASSTWCLDELVKILECKMNYGQIVIPVFYHVDPSHVRHLKGIFEKSFSEHKKRFQEDKLESWETALKTTANLSGFHVQDNRPESECVGEIVDSVLKRLKEKWGSNEIDHLIGVKSIINKLEKKLSTAPTSVYTLGIWGIGGIGKTTIARAIFEKISNCFEGSCLLENVRERKEKIGLYELKELLFSSLLGGEDEKIDLTKDRSFNLERLKRKKVVVVFDDVTRFDQIESLIESLHSFGDGSRIIITTRDRKVLDQANEIYEVKGLSHDNALKLFNQNAFPKNHPSLDFLDLSKEIIKYASGVPLALKVLGRFLSGRSIEEWKSAIKELKKIPNPDIQKVLQISYDGLDDRNKKIFLDIVCFFKGRSKDKAIEFLDACGFSPIIGIEVLKEKGLIEFNDIITMHDLIEDMGKEIIRLESVDFPGKRSRLFHDEDIYKVLTLYTGTENIEGIVFNMSKVKEARFNLSIFKKMPELRYLEFYGENKCKISPFRRPVFFELRVFHWNGYPRKSLPWHFNPEYLISIKLRNSKIKKLWDGNQNLHNLKHIDLSFSKQLEKLPDLKNAPNLENLILEGCSSLVEIDLSSESNKLVEMNLLNCESLKSLPPRIDSKSLNDLFLSGCKNLMRFPDISSCNIKRLVLDTVAIEELPSSIECLSRLYSLCISNCSRLKQLPTSICKLKSLRSLCLSDCSNLQRLPDNIGHLKGLCELYVNRTPIEKVPSSIGSLKSLKYLHLSDCLITELPESICELSSLENLCLFNCSGLGSLPDALGDLECLKYLTVKSTIITAVPSSIVRLRRLYFLGLIKCERLLCLPELPKKLVVLNVDNCKSLQVFPCVSIFSRGEIRRVEKLHIDQRNCFQLDQNELSIIVKKALQSIQRMDTESRKSIEEEVKFEWDSSSFRLFSDRYDRKIWNPVIEIPPPGNIILESRYNGIQIPTYKREILHPGSEIPEWFHCRFRGMGASGFLELPQDWLHHNIIGVVVCAIVTKGVKYDDDRLNYKAILNCSWKVNTKNGGAIRVDILGDSSPDFSHIGGFRRRGRHCGSDHVILDYKICGKIFPKSFDERRSNNQAFIEFSAFKDPSMNVFKEPSVKVKEWGIHFLYRQDFREFMKDDSSDGDNFDDSSEIFTKDFDDSSDGDENANGEDSKSEEKSNDEQEEPHPKRLKH